MISLHKSPKEVADQIVKIAKEERARWITDLSANVRRLAAFTEDEVAGTLAGNDSTSTTNENVEQAVKRYATSFNLTRGHFQRLLGRVMPAITSFQVLASSIEQEDRDAAFAGAGLLRSRTSADSGQDFEQICRAFSFLFCGGPAYLSVEKYVPPGEESGDVVTKPHLGCMVHLFPGIADDPNDSPACVWDEFCTLTQILARYPEFMDQGDEQIDFEALPGAKWPDDVNWDDLNPKLSEGVYNLRRLLYRPSQEYPEGHEWVSIVGMAEEAYIERPTLDTYDRKYPFVKLSDVPMSPFYNDRGRMSISSPAQRAYDIAISKAMDLTIGGPQTAIGFPIGGNINRDDFSNSPFFFYDKVPGQDIKVDQMPGLGNLGEVIQLCRSHLEEVHSQHGPSRGVTPGTRTSGSALEQLVGADMASDEPFLAMARRSMGRYGMRVLGEGQRTWPKSHTYQILGRHRYYETVAFHKAKLKEGYSVRVLPDQGLPQNKAARMQLTIKGLGEGLFANTEDAQKARDLLGIYADEDTLYGANQAEEQLIRKEEEQIATGMPPPTNWSDNHPLHYMRHRENNTTRLSGDLQTPLSAQAAMSHAQQHQMAMMPPLPPAGPIPPGAPGAPGGPGGPPGPSGSLPPGGVPSGGGIPMPAPAGPGGPA